MKNDQIAATFEQLADLLEIQEANPFRVRAYRSAARKISSTAESFSSLVEEGADLTQYSGIGKDLAKQIEEFVTTGQHAQLVELKTQVPPGVIDMLRIAGVGPKKVAVFFHKLNLTSLDELKAAAEAGKLAALKGFGKKTEQSILENIDLAAEAGQRISIARAREAADAIVDDLLQVKDVKQAAVAGSCRRRKETCGDLDVLATSASAEAAMDRLAENPLVESVLQRGDTKMRVRLNSGIELDLRVVPDESYGAALQYFTGSKEHNVVVRQKAKDLVLKVNEYGVFRGDEQIAGATEEDVYAALDLPWIPPELRENRLEFNYVEHGKLPELVTVADIKGDLHMHTTASDGAASILEMAEAAKARGLKYIAITDHSKRVSMANGLDADRLRKHWQDIRKVREQIKGIEILCGIECDILEDATMDLPDDVLAEADWVVAVLHYGLQQPREQIMKRLLTAIKNPHVNIIGHPTGRMVGKREGADVDIKQMLQAAADHGVMMEINAHYKRLDLDDVNAAAARDLGIPIVISTDSHSVNGFDVLQYGVDQARRAGLSKADVANTKTWAQFKKLLNR
ncbi:DNA polymerase/3'-5' exonuclease PolX [Fuerstiella marisgermanici]|uniref:DNA polymerase beta n=1 Tax=Fuerstiella marisgermanici TaxID=1891926 RepID=A0A1P8WK52_9PLAN|nr:DNA polymerase/3'-5' exonuclease PolX [Fuerstiella marisgermanici]APZ94444.1 DNA polymerase/3'-5' exonuclease PolX [Fuerstiella marisgermanici]